MAKVHDKYNQLFQAVLSEIESEMCRMYWNKNQKELNSPFQNTGNSYENNTFKVHAYRWDDDNSTPNFQWKNVEIFWYKHSRRGIYVNISTEDGLTLDLVNDMLSECIASLREDFGEVNND